MGKIGFIDRNHVVIENEQPPSKTMLNELPLNFMDTILEKSLLRWTLTFSSHQRDRDVIKTLASVDLCWFQQVTRPIFKKKIWQRLKDFYWKTKKICGILRNNRKYLLRNIQPTDEFIASLLSFNCITEQQSHVIKRQRSNQDRNGELLHFLGNFNQTMCSDFVRCLQRTNHKIIARVVENGGVAIKAKVSGRCASGITSFDSQLVCQTINGRRYGARPRSPQTDKLIGQLKEEGIEFLNIQLDRQIVVVWIWCRSQAAFEYIWKFHVSDQLREVLFGFSNIQTSTFQIQSQVVEIDSIEFQKTAVVCPILFNIPHIIDIGRIENVRGVTILQSKLYVLSTSFSSPVIEVFEDKNPLNFLRKIDIKEIKFAFDIGSCDNENCLYVSDYDEKCIWKIKRERESMHKLSKWLIMDYKPMSMSVSSGGQLLLVKVPSSILMIYGSDATLLRSIQLQCDIEVPRHAVETSIGTFIILHQSLNKEDKVEIGSSQEKMAHCWVISEVSRDGQMAINRFVPSDETQKMNDPHYLSLDSGDRVFMADYRNNRVILLESNLKWNRILCPRKAEEEASDDVNRFRGPRRLCYDEEKKQLIVGGDAYLQDGEINRNYNETEIWTHSGLKESLIEEKMLRAVRDFDPKQMKYRQKIEVEHIFKSQKRDSGESYNAEDKVDLLAKAIPSKKGDEMKTIHLANIRDSDRWWKVRNFNSRKIGFIPRDCIVLENDQQPLNTQMIKDMMPQSSFTTEDKIKLRAVQDFDPKQMRQSERIEIKEILDKQRRVVLGSDSDENDNLGDKVDPYAEAIPFDKGDKMETVSPASICDNVEWWEVRHLKSEQIGFIPRNRAVIENDQPSSGTMLNELPLELFDMILEYTLLLWMVKFSSHQRRADFIKSLAAVDFCWCKRITRRRFKKGIWLHVKDLKEARGSAIIRKNRNYLSENIHPNEELIALLLSLNCITEEQSQSIQRQRSTRDKNDKLLYFLRSVDKTKSSNVVRCLRRTNQKSMARIIQNGGVVIKVEIRHQCGTRRPTTSTETQKLVHQRFEYLRNRSNPWSNKTDKIISELNDKGIEILSSQMDRQTVVVWMWCRSQPALQYLQKLYDSNQLGDVLSDLTDIRPEIMQSKVINVHSNQFGKTVVVYPSSVRLTEIIDVERDERACGVTKLRNEIYVLCESSFDAPHVIRVFEDQNPFRLQRKIEIKVIKDPFDIGSSEKENCLYISDMKENCIWKITREADDQHKIIKWLEPEDMYSNFSVSRDDHILLLLNLSPCCLMIFGSDAKLVRSIPLPRNFKRLWRAMETSTGNFIIIHTSSEIKSIDDEDEEEQSDDQEEEESDDDYDKKDDDDEGKEDSDNDYDSEGDDDEEEEDSNDGYDVEHDDEEEDMEEKKEQLNDGTMYIEEKEVKKRTEAECMKEKKDEREEEKESGSRERKSMEDEEEEEDENLRERRSCEGNKKYYSCISEVTRDGQVVIRRFIPLNEKQKLIRTQHLALDLDDRVFVADLQNSRVVLLDDNLKWNRIICETKEENDEEDDNDNTVLQPDFLCYDEEKEQLIVSGLSQRGVHVYTLGRI